MEQRQEREQAAAVDAEDAEDANAPFLREELRTASTSTSTSTKMNRWEAFVTTTDWSGRAMQDTWHGRHHPCRRIALWVHLTSLLTTMVWFWHAASTWPLLRLQTSDQELRAMQAAQAACAWSLCEAVEDVEFVCEMSLLDRDKSSSSSSSSSSFSNSNSNKKEFGFEYALPMVGMVGIHVDNGGGGVSMVDVDIHVDMDSLEGIDPIIPFPQQCNEAIRLTFGHATMEELLWSDTILSSQDDQDQNKMPTLDLLHLKEVSKWPSSSSSSSTDDYPIRWPLFQLLPDECVLRETILEMGLMSHWLGDYLPAESFGIDLMDFMTAQPGDRTRVAFRDWVCPHHMSRPLQQIVFSQWGQIYDLLMEWRRTTVLCIMYWSSMILCSGMCATRILLLLLPATLLWIVVLRRHHHRHGHRHGRRRRAANLPNHTPTTTPTPPPRITLFNTIATLLLLVTITEEGMGPATTAQGIRTVLLVASALVSYDNSKAAMEWMFLFGLSYMDLSSLFRVFDESLVVTGLYQWDNGGGGVLGLLPWVEDLLFYLLPGSGLWKLVTIYVVYMALPTTTITTTKPTKSGGTTTATMAEELDDHHLKHD